MSGPVGKTGIVAGMLAAGSALLYLSVQKADARKASIVRPQLGDFHVRPERSGGGI